MSELLNELMKTAVVINEGRTRARAANPDLMKVLGKATAADDKYRKAKILRDKALSRPEGYERAVLGRYEKNRKRFGPSSDLKEQLGYISEGRKELRSLRGNPNADPKNIEKTRNLIKADINDYKKMKTKNPDALKNYDHNLKYFKKSEQHFEDYRDGNIFSLGEMLDAKKERADASREYSNLRKPLPPKPAITKQVTVPEPKAAGLKTLEPIVAKPIVDPNIKPTQPTSGHNRYLKPLAIGAGAAATIGGGAYLYNRYKKKKQAEAEAEKTAVTKEEKVELRRMVGMAKRKVKKKKPNKTKESMYRMKQVKKHAAIPEAELEKMASLMADQFIAATGLSNINPEEMDFETEILAGYKAFTDEVAE